MWPCKKSSVMQRDLYFSALGKLSSSAQNRVVSKLRRGIDLKRQSKQIIWGIFIFTGVVKNEALSQKVSLEGFIVVHKALFKDL